MDDMLAGLASMHQIDRELLSDWDTDFLNSILGKQTTPSEDLIVDRIWISHGRPVE